MLSQIIFYNSYLFLIIYINFAIEIKFFLNQKIAQIDIADTRLKFFQFYNIIFIHLDFIKMKKI